MSYMDRFFLFWLVYTYSVYTDLVCGHHYLQKRSRSWNQRNITKKDNRLDIEAKVKYLSEW